MIRSSTNGKEVEETRNTIVEEYSTFFEVVTHEILFLRGLYPDAVFERRRKYDTIVHMSRHPELNFYIHETFHRIKPLLTEGSIKKVIICFKDKNEIPIEHYSFMFDHQTQKSMLRSSNSNVSSHLPAYQDLHNAFRSFLLKLMMQKPQQKLSSKCSFQILIYCDSIKENSGLLATSSSASSYVHELIKKGEFLTVEANEASIFTNCSELEEPYGEHIKTMLKETEYHMEIFYQSKKKRNE